MARLLLLLALIFPAAAHALDCTSVAKVTTPVTITLMPQTGGKYVASVRVNGVILIQNVYTLPMSGTWIIYDSFDDGATWCTERGSTSFTLALGTDSVTVAVPLIVPSLSTNIKVVSSPSGAVEPYAVGLNVTWSRTTSTPLLP